MKRNFLSILVLFALATACGVEFPRGEAAYVVASPKTELEKRVANRLTNYLSQVLGKPTKVVSRLSSVPSGKSAIVLANKKLKPQKNSAAEISPEAFVLETGIEARHPFVYAQSHSERGLKRAVQRLILESDQRESGLVIPDLHLSESPWIPEREWTICPWQPDLVRGTWWNNNADKRLNIWHYSDEQIAKYVEMFDWFGFSGCQLMETCYNYAAGGSPEAFQALQKKFAQAVHKNGQDVTLWVWAAQFDGFGWVDPGVTYVPAKGNTAFDDPKVRATFEKYYNHYANLAPYADRLVAHFYDPGSLKSRADVFKYLRLLDDKFKAKNPKIKLAVDFWAAGSPGEYMQQLIDNGFGDALLLELTLPHTYPAGKREALHEEAKKRGLNLGVWGWYTTEYETDQMPTMHVNAQLLKNFYQQIQNGADKISPITYWSEMEAYHLNNIFTMYAASQLLWNPNRAPHEILREISEGIWGPRNGPKILETLELIQDTRSGSTWETFWWTLPTHRLGTENPQNDLRRAEIFLANLEQMKTDNSFVPKFPLPFPPETFVELMIPHLKQIKTFAQFRIEVDHVYEAEKSGSSKEELKKLAEAAWKPVPEFNTWIGTFGQPEAATQEKILTELAKDFGIEINPPAWLRYRDADRLLGRIQMVQRRTSTPWKFKLDQAALCQEFNWTPEKCRDRVQKLVDDGAVEKVGDDLYQLTNWTEFRRP